MNDAQRDDRRAALFLWGLPFVYAFDLATGFLILKPAPGAPHPDLSGYAPVVLLILIVCAATGYYVRNGRFRPLRYVIGGFFALGFALSFGFAVYYGGKVPWWFATLQALSCGWAVCVGVFLIRGARAWARGGRGAPQAEIRNPQFNR